MKLYAKQVTNTKIKLERFASPPSDKLWLLVPREPEENERVRIKKGKVVLLNEKGSASGI